KLVIKPNDFLVASPSGGFLRSDDQDELIAMCDEGDKYQFALKGDFAPTATTNIQAEIHFPAGTTDKRDSVYRLLIEQYENGYCVGGLEYRFADPVNSGVYSTGSSSTAKENRENAK